MYNYTFKKNYVITKCVYLKKKKKSQCSNRKIDVMGFEPTRLKFN